MSVSFSPSKLMLLLLFVLFLALAQHQAHADTTWTLNDAFASFQPDDPHPSIPITFLSNYDQASAFLIVSGTRSNATVDPSHPIAPYLAFVSFDSNQSFFLCIYIIAYGLTPDGAIVWTANRDSPFAGRNASLSLQGDGDLQLRSGDGTLVWATNTSNLGVQGMELTAVSPAGLILYGSGDNIVWRSSDFPTDTLTAGQTLQPGKRLVSWTSITDPSSGFYSLVMEPGGLALYDNSFPEPQPYWIWGFFGNDSFSVMHTCRNLISADVSNYRSLVLSISDNVSNDSTFCSTQIASGKTLTLPFADYNTAAAGSNNDGLFLRLIFDGSLQARQLLITSKWDSQFDLFAGNKCFLPRSCGPYSLCSPLSQTCDCPAEDAQSLNIFVATNSSRSPAQGCLLVSPFNCSIDPSDAAMIPLSGVDYFSTKYLTPSGISTEQSCVGDCKQNCSCLAAFWHRFINTCFHVSSQIETLQQADKEKYVAYLKVGNSIPESNSPLAHSTASRSHKIAMAAATSVVAALIVLACVTFCIYKSLRGHSEEEDPFLDVIPGLPTRFSYKDLQAMTIGFTAMLGRGGFGAVYEGVFSDGTKVAVKQLESVSQGDKEFRSEVRIMGAIHHFNVLRLLGFCAEGKHRLLVYECMENGSLDKWLFDDRYVKESLNWELRCKIARGAARGLAYLHDECREKIIHLDVKPQNILLDLDFVPKVADMGLSRLVGRAESPRAVTTMRGTPGYLAPEWLKEGNIDEKCDVFSYGMLLMEIISGRKNFNKDKDFSFPEWAYRKVQTDQNLTELTNAEIETKADFEQLKQMIKTAFLCVVDNPASRPSMNEVVQMLEGGLLVSDTRVSNLSQDLVFVLGNVKESSFACTSSSFSSKGASSSKACTSTSSNTMNKIRGSRSISYRQGRTLSASQTKEISLSQVQG